MPIYEYLCGHCGHQFDEIRAIENSSHSECRCGDFAEKLPSAGSYTGNFGSGSTAPRHKRPIKKKFNFKVENESS